MNEKHQRIIERLQLLHDWIGQPIDENALRRHLKNVDATPEERDLLAKLFTMTRHALKDDDAAPTKPTIPDTALPSDNTDRRVLKDRRSGLDRRATSRPWNRRSNQDRRGNVFYRHRVKETSETE